MAGKKDKISGINAVFLMVVIFILGFTLGVYREIVVEKTKTYLPPLVKKAEVSIRKMFGIDE